MPKFFTLPPRSIPYPYVLVSAYRAEEGMRYLTVNRDYIEAVIIDSGVEVFRHNPGLKDYPGGARAWVSRVVRLYEKARRLVPDAEVVVTVPDYPDDYWHKQLWLSDSVTNIERTVENIEYCLEHYSDVEWLIPIQGWWEQPESIVRSLRLLEERGVLKRVEQMCRARHIAPCIALANLCVSKKCSTILRTTLIAYNFLRYKIRPPHYYKLSTRIHVFGPAVNCIKQTTFIYSWDSLAWTKPREPGGSSCWNQAERAYLFITWIHKYADLIELPPHPKTMQKRAAAKLSPQI